MNTPSDGRANRDWTSFASAFAIGRERDMHVVHSKTSKFEHAACSWINSNCDCWSVILREAAYGVVASFYFRSRNMAAAVVALGRERDKDSDAV